MAQRGGKREGSGLPKGFKFDSTKEKLKAKRLMEQRILKRINPLLNSQMVLAQGLTYVYRIDEIKDSKGNVKRETVLVTDPEEIRLFLDEHEGGDGVVDETYYFITSKPPDNRAIDSMLDRVFGRATQSLELDNPGQNAQMAEMNDKLNKMFLNAKSSRK